MGELSRDIRYALRQAWKWPETYISVFCLVIVMSIIISMAVRLQGVTHLEYQIEAIRGQNTQAVEDIHYLQNELKDTRATIKDLQAKIKLDSNP